MDGAILIAIIGILAAPVAAIVTWLTNRKKHVADIYESISESSQNAVETMQLTMNELRTELVEAKNKIDELITENKLLRDDLVVLKSQNQQLLLENKALERKIEDLSEQIRGMR
jgi:5-bromo-4-chloroindolyl phosphate hydrolysis protein